MKKIILTIIIGAFVFANSLNDRVSKLENEMTNLKSEVTNLKQIVDKLNHSQEKIITSQKKIETNIQKGVVLKCNKLKLLKFDYKYSRGFVPTYDLYYTFQNDYNKTIRYVYATISIYDNEDNNLLEDFIKEDITIKPHQIVHIHTVYTMDQDVGLAKYLKTTPKKDLVIKVHPWTIIFKDNTTLKCQ